MSLWLAFEGIDGSGKSAVSARVADALRAQGVEVVLARENGRYASPIAGRVRELARSAENLRLAPEAELLLQLAREAQVVAEVVEPALRRGAWVVTDRAAASHLALARRVRGLDGPELDAAARLAARGRAPDQVVLVDADPDVARWRRRLRKLGAPAEPGRKGLLGDALGVRLRAAYLERARAGGWTVLGNTWRPAEATARAAVDALSGRTPAPEPAGGFAADVDDLPARYYAFAGRLADRGLAAMLVAGLDDPRAAAIRREAPAAAGAYAAGGLDTEDAWVLRAELALRAPDPVARGLEGLSADPRAWELRHELEDVAPEAVLLGLAGDVSREAQELRARLFGAHPAAALRGARGLADAGSWELRRRARRRGLSAALAESLAGLDDLRARALRTEHAPAFPLAALRGGKGVDAPDAWALRRELAPWAPKAVLASIEGMDGAEASALRRGLRSAAPEEVAASLAGLDTEEAWRRREDLADDAPAGVLKSLRRIDAGRGAALARRLTGRHGSRLRVAREAMQFLGRTACRTAST